MAQFKVGDTVKFEANGELKTGIIEKWSNVHSSWVIKTTDNWTCAMPESLLTHCDYLAPQPITITATLTTDTIPTELLKQLSASGFLITIKAV